MGPAVAGAAPTLRLWPAGQGASDAIVRADDAAEALIDPTGQLGLAEVRGGQGATRFRPLTELGSNFAYTSSAVWLRLRVENAGPSEAVRTLDLGRAWIDHARIAVSRRSARATSW